MSILEYVSQYIKENGVQFTYELPTILRDMIVKQFIVDNAYGSLWEEMVTRKDEKKDRQRARQEARQEIREDAKQPTLVSW